MAQQQYQQKHLNIANQYRCRHIDLTKLKYLCRRHLQPPRSHHLCLNRTINYVGLFPQHKLNLFSLKGIVIQLQASLR